jgi:tRNA-splicing ligase RtcB
MKTGEIALEKIDEFRWQIPATGQMRVPGLIFATEGLLPNIQQDQSPRQVANVAHLPGILKASMAMPDMHWGYGFPIGGVAATSVDDGVISPGGVGYDINCGCRLLRTNLQGSDVQSRMRDLVESLFHGIPCGVGGAGAIRLSEKKEKDVLTSGARWAVENGFGESSDLERTEDGGCIKGADPETLSPRALERGRDQLGTLGSGNHFLEIQVVEEIYDPQAAEAMELEKDQVAVMIHSGSRGLGYQVCDDYIKVMNRAVRKYGISLPDRQLACAPFASEEGQQYFKAMACAANYAWANRQCLMHWTRKIFEKVLKVGPRDLGMRLVYDVCHNIAKLEEHEVDGRPRQVCVHRKGATRAFAPGSPDLPWVYRSIGQPVLIPGDMGTHSYVLVGAEGAMAETFGSTCHGAGRVKSRAEACRTFQAGDLLKSLAEKGVRVMAKGKKTLLEEAPGAYKDVSQVVDVVDRAGICRKVARLRPMGVIKG